ncbi:hypothetical protein G3R49_15230 [Shewanella sp. WXL01]|uniref:hypothetical protein n=1 Tax=Shewanella sp. WXL01 TaxID=2709721 RepID=UPI0014383224|nr:hypothetical protein [Shewanella sp. WXL01]NKF51916.1 hypothetical protein [Shewanella sp. WXL01]
MKKQIIAGLVAGLIVSGLGIAASVQAQPMTQTLDTETAIGIGGLMICDVFYNENEMPIQGAIVKKAVLDHQKAGIEDHIMTQETSNKLEQYFADFRASSEEQKMHLCNQAIEFARNSTFVK